MAVVLCLGNGFSEAEIDYEVAYQGPKPGSGLALSGARGVVGTPSLPPDWKLATAGVISAWLVG